MSFLNRLSGRTSRLAGVVLPGAWLVEAPAVTEPEGVAIDAGGYVVCGVLGRFLVRAGGDRAEGATPATAAPGEIDQECVAALGEHLEELEKTGATWDAWARTSPLVPGASDRVKVLPFEERIAELLGALELVCRRPRAHLRIEHELVPVSRARRTPAAALDRLSTHTEDWHRITVRGVVPRVVLSESRADELDIYENRVAARLVDHLAQYLARRTHEVGRLQKLFDALADYSKQAAGPYARAHRVCGLWGETFNASEDARRARRTLRRLLGLKSRVDSLVGTSLYRAVPRRTSLQRSIRMTNVFAGDGLYRKVSNLWREWTRGVDPEERDPARITARQQFLARSFERYVALVVVRALEQLGVGLALAGPQQPIARGADIELAGGRRLVWTSSGTLEVVSGGGDTKTLVRIVPLFAALLSDPDDEVNLARLKGAAADAFASSAPTVVVYVDPGPAQGASSPAAWAGHALANDPSHRLSERVGFVPVSPHEIESVERVARAIRWHLSSAAYTQLPATVPAPPKGLVSSDGCSGWLRPTGDPRHWAIVRPPDPDEVEALGLKLRQARLDGELGALGRRLDGLRGEKGRVEAGRVRELIAAKRTERDALAQLDAFVGRVTDATNELTQCPVCPRRISGRRDFHTGDDATFRCACPECGTTWGTRVCGTCRARVPFIGLRQTAVVAAKTPASIDRLFGRDVLSLPRIEDGQVVGYLCPRCDGTGRPTSPARRPGS